jgi:glycosyltransferase involved in cell wall biosynthesis
MSYPAISVITPCYNGAMYLRQTIESVLTQTYPPLEMIVVDDGSTDDSAAIAESFGPPVRVIRQRNAGTAAARDAGLALAQGEYIHFLDGDDLLQPDSFAAAPDAAYCRLIAKSHVHLVVTPCRRRPVSCRRS